MRYQVDCWIWRAYKSAKWNWKFKRVVRTRIKILFVESTSITFYLTLLLAEWIWTTLEIGTHSYTLIYYRWLFFSPYSGWCCSYDLCFKTCVKNTSDIKISCENYILYPFPLPLIPIRNTAKDTVTLEYKTERTTLRKLIRRTWIDAYIFLLWCVLISRIIILGALQSTTEQDYRWDYAVLRNAWFCKNRA